MEFTFIYLVVLANNAQLTVSYNETSEFFVISAG